MTCFAHAANFGCSGRMGFGDPAAHWPAAAAPLGSVPHGRKRGHLEAQET